MPISTRSSTPLPRSYLYDERLNGIPDPLTREAYLRVKTVCDNLGRMPANPAMLAGTLFPCMPPNTAEMGRIIQQWDEAGLVFHYQVGARWYIEICDHGLTSKLVGNMSADSEYPAPPPELIERWKVKFGSEWRCVERKSKNGKTRSYGYEQVQTRSPEEKGSEVKSREGKKSEVKSRESDRGADAPVSSLDDLDIDEPLTQEEETNVFLLWSSVTAGKFKSALAFAEKDNPRFKRVVLFLYKQKPPRSLADKIALMSAVIDECEEREVRYPEGWLKALSELRAENTA